MVKIPLVAVSRRASIVPGGLSPGEGAIPPLEGEWLLWGEDPGRGEVLGWLVLDWVGVSLGDELFGLLIDKKEETIGLC